MSTTGFPATLWVVRHGQSAGNVARDAAEAQGLHVIDIATRDIDVPLSELGRNQSISLGHWFGTLGHDALPQIVLCSPYVRAVETAQLLLESAGLKGHAKLRLDERLREKEFGILDRLTTTGIRQKYPELSEQRRHVGKFYFRPPGGESWCDVILRLRSLLEMTTREYSGCRVLVVAHQVIVNCMRYLIEQLDEARILGMDRLADVPNCGVTSYRRAEDDEGREMLALDLANFVAPLLAEGTPVTVAPDQPVAHKP
ncbi:MAG: histidine phosphatase family protein [Pseudomonadota bacterium]